MNREYIENKLIDIGIAPANKGFRYITDAIMIMKNPEWKCDKITVLYDAIARINGSTYGGVEKGIRYSLNMARKNGNKETARYLGQEYRQNKNTLIRLCRMINEI